MPVHHNDRARRMLGDRILVRAPTFAAIHPALDDVHATFGAAHAQLLAAAEARQREVNESKRARRTRAQAFAEAKRLYGWAYHELRRLLAPGWNARPDPDDLAILRRSLFPLGAPSDIDASAQLTLDALTQFLIAAGQQGAVRFPADFLADAQAARDALHAALTAVTQTSTRAHAALQAQNEARARWDRCFAALRELTTGYLRLQGREAEAPALFRKLPERPSPEADDSPPQDPAVPTPVPDLEPEPT